MISGGLPPTGRRASPVDKKGAAGIDLQRPPGAVLELADHHHSDDLLLLYRHSGRSPRLWRSCRTAKAVSEQGRIAEGAWMSPASNRSLSHLAVEGLSFLRKRRLAASSRRFSLRRADSMRCSWVIWLSTASFLARRSARLRRMRSRRSDAGLCFLRAAKAFLALTERCSDVNE